MKVIFIVLSGLSNVIRCNSDSYLAVYCVCPQHGDSREFLWRLARAYSDMYESAKDKQEKKNYAQQGNEYFALLL